MHWKVTPLFTFQVLEGTTVDTCRTTVYISWFASSEFDVWWRWIMNITKEVRLLWFCGIELTKIVKDKLWTKYCYRGLPQGRISVRVLMTGDVNQRRWGTILVFALDKQLQPVSNPVSDKEKQIVPEFCVSFLADLVTKLNEIFTFIEQCHASCQTFLMLLWSVCSGHHAFAMVCSYVMLYSFDREF